MFDELTELKYFIEMKGWQSLCKSWGVFGTQASIYDEAFLWK